MGARPAGSRRGGVYTSMYIYIYIYIYVNIYIYIYIIFIHLYIDMICMYHYKGHCESSPSPHLKSC